MLIQFKFIISSYYLKTKNQIIKDIIKINKQQQNVDDEQQQHQNVVNLDKQQSLDQQSILQDMFNRKYIEDKERMIRMLQDGSQIVNKYICIKNREYDQQLKIMNQEKLKYLSNLYYNYNLKDLLNQLNPIESEYLKVKLQRNEQLIQIVIRKVLFENIAMKVGLNGLCQSLLSRKESQLKVEGLIQKYREMNVKNTFKQICKYQMNDKQNEFYRQRLMMIVNKYDNVQRIQLSELIYQLRQKIIDNINNQYSLQCMLNKYKDYKYLRFYFEQLLNMMNSIKIRQMYRNKVYELAVVQFNRRKTQYMNQQRDVFMICKLSLILDQCRLEYSIRFKNSLIHVLTQTSLQKKAFEKTRNTAIDNQENYIESLIEQLNQIKKIHNIEKFKYHFRIRRMVLEKYLQLREQFIKDLFVQSEDRTRMKTDFKLQKIVEKYRIQFKEVSIEVLVESIRRVKCQQKVQEMFNSSYDKFRTEYLSEYRRNLDGFIDQKRKSLKEQIIKQLQNRGLRCYQINYDDYEIWSEEQKIVRMIFINRESQVDQEQYQQLLKYFTEHFVLSFLHLKGPLLSIYDMKARSIRQEFMNIYWNDQNNIQDRMDSLIIVLIFQILYKEQKFVNESLTSCFQFLNENKQQIENHENIQKILLIWEFWNNIFMNTNTKEYVYYDKMYVKINSCYIHQLEYFQQVDCQFSLFQLKSAVNVWEVMDYQSYEQNKERMKEVKYDEDNKYIYDQVQEILINSIRLVFKTSSQQIQYFEDKLLDTEYSFRYLIFRIYYFYNKHVYGQYKRSLHLDNFIQRQVIKCRSRMEQTDDQSQINEYDLMVSISSKINNNNINVNDYINILQTDSQNLTFIYTITRLFIKFCHFNQQYLQIADECINHLLSVLNTKRDKFSISLVFYQRVLYLQTKKYHKKAVQLIEIVIVFFKVYGHPFIKKMNDLIDYQKSIHKAIIQFDDQIDRFLINKRSTYQTKVINNIETGDCLEDFDPYAFQLLGLVYNQQKDKYFYQNFYDRFSDRYESAMFYWNYSQQNYFIINRQWKFRTEYQRDMKQNHPVLIYKQVKPLFNSIYDINHNCYIGLSPFQMLEMINKQHYGSNQTKIKDLLRILQYKSYLRVNASKSLIKSRLFFSQFKQVIMGYFYAKTFIQYTIQKQNESNIEDINDQYQQELQSINIQEIYFIIQKVLSISEDQYLKIKTTFLYGQALWVLDQQYEKARVYFKKCYDLVQKTKYPNHKVQEFIKKKNKIKYFESTKT